MAGVRAVEVEKEEGSDVSRVGSSRANLSCLACRISLVAGWLAVTGKGERGCEDGGG